MRILERNENIKDQAYLDKKILITISTVVMGVKILSLKQRYLEKTKNTVKVRVASLQLRSEKERIERTFKDGEELGRREIIREREKKKRKKENEMKKCNIYRGRRETTNVESLSFLSLVEREIRDKASGFCRRGKVIGAWYSRERKRHRFILTIQPGRICIDWATGLFAGFDRRYRLFYKYVLLLVF